MDNHAKENLIPKESLIHTSRDPLINILNKLVVLCVKCLAIIMVFLIFWAMLDVLVHVYTQITASTQFAFSAEQLITTLGSVLAVLIAIEIFLNIIFYLKQDAIHVPLVLATALTAVSRKVIILDYSYVSHQTLLAIAALILSLGLSYWLITKQDTNV